MRLRTLEIYKNLDKKKIDILNKYLENSGNEIFAEYCKKYHKQYYENVCDELEKLGDETMRNGHSKMLDKEKNAFFNLLNLHNPIK
jgi:thiaminase